jgi:hypothetical protein
MANALSDALNAAIGDQTRIFLAKVVSIDFLSQGRVTAFSEYVGNMEVTVGNIRWLRVDDWVFVTRAASAEKYQPYLYIGWAGNSSVDLGTPMLYNPLNVATILELPTWEDGARLGEIRAVGGTVDTETGLTTGGTLYTFIEVNGTKQWVQFGGSGAAARRSFGWFVRGGVEVGMLLGPVYKIDTDATIENVVITPKIVGLDPITIDVRIGPNLDDVTSIFGGGGVEVSGAGVIVPTVTALPADSFVVFDIVAYEGSTMTDLTVQFYFSAV